MISLCVVAPAQSVTEFPIPNGFGSRGITAGPDGNLWFTEYTKVGRVTPSGVITLYDTPTFSFYNNGIAAGSDGNLWFTEQAGIIGRITPAGAITEFPLPATFPAPNPGAIAAGPDGNLWFTETAVVDTGVVGRIGRITTAGGITEFPVTAVMSSGAAVALSGIAAGPDGNLWFTKTGENKIGRITTGGVATEFPIPTPGSDPSFITAGPDGNLWFTEAKGQIGRITTGGVVTEFPIPSVIASGFTMGPSGITVGPDGNIWFTEYLNSTVGRITPSGVMTEFPFPSWRNPYGIALWLRPSTSAPAKPEPTMPSSLSAARALSLSTVSRGLAPRTSSSTSPDTSSRRLGASQLAQNGAWKLAAPTGLEPVPRP